ncbi:MAG: glutamate formimidoyltransferase [Pseudomonadota bacterium]|nr:glutamate formimidoyltransferase [Pseudomonadota bacterium]
MTILECVPNFSEGRSPEKVREIAEAAAGVPGVSVLDYSWDADHNRSVVTFLGGAEGVYHAALAAGGKALEIIDLRGHDGAHPRIGAVDVVPFIPLAGAQMTEAVYWARRFGHAFAERHGIPVFFYGEAAVDPVRRQLPDIRRGGLAGLIDRLCNGDWHPDAGPSTCPERAGAVAVGARMPLIAYNINLKTADISLAKHIAGRIREAGGGLPGVRAIGVFLASRKLAQVSMNLTDFRVTSLRDAFAFVSREAAGAGVEILESELIGLAPRAALNAETAAAILLKDFSPAKIIETHLGERKHRGPARIHPEAPR